MDVILYRSSLLYSLLVLKHLTSGTKITSNDLLVQARRASTKHAFRPLKNPRRGAAKLKLGNIKINKMKVEKEKVVSTATTNVCVSTCI